MLSDPPTSLAPPYHVPVDPILAALAASPGTGLLPARAGILLAVSGGADSTALLLGAAELAGRFGWRLAVGHVHHGWRGEAADRDRDFVAGLSRRLGLPFLEGRGRVEEIARRHGLSPEAAGRHLRYRELLEMGRRVDASRIATAHQQDDVLESLWIARERRAGLARMAGPRVRREDGVVRPLLSVTRGQVLAFLADRGQSWRRDSTNGNLRLARTRARRQIARLRSEPGGEEELQALLSEARACRSRLDELEAEWQARVRPGVRQSGGGVLADARLLASCSPDLARLALERLASPMARPGHPPFTGREREQVLERLAQGHDFRFEAGRHIRVERRAGTLLVQPLERDCRVYDFRK
jgi:tRNA(Ile)-lysidine synthetase-like protein